MSDLPRELREAARSHRPDRARMLARIERARPDTRGAPARRTRPAWPRAALAGFAAAGACVIGGFAVASVLQQSDVPGSSVVQEGGREEQATPAPRETPTGPTPAPTRGGALSTTDGPLWADGSVAPDDDPDRARSEVTLKSQEPLTALTVELLVPQTGQVRSTGTSQTRPDGDFDHSVHERDGVLVHRWTLRAGRTVPAGTQVFAGEYDHAPGGRDAAPDTYRATARTAGGSTYEVGGDFARTT